MLIHVIIGASRTYKSSAAYINYLESPTKNYDDSCCLFPLKETQSKAGGRGGSMCIQR